MSKQMHEVFDNFQQLEASSKETETNNVIEDTLASSTDSSNVPLQRLSALKA